ncbi:hypothetical protein JXA63_02735 [Candidatus Woesebacteria bacterium]|nr:hypothetical protein [Candidatus Woesebacteria bacterium]
MDLIYKIDPNIRVILKPLMFIVIAFGFLIFTINTGFSQINKQMTKLQNINDKEDMLNTKLNILRNIQEGLLEYSNASLIAVPDKNPAVWSVSSLRQSIYENDLTLTKVQARANASNKNLFNVTIELELKGSLRDLVVFADSLDKQAPIVKKRSMEISREGGKYTADIELSTYWAELPKKIPAINEPITSLSVKELEILVDIKNLLRPDFDVLEPQQDSLRESPFLE